MAVTWLGKVGSATNKTSGTSLAVTNTSASVIPAGTLLLMVVGYDNHASLTAATVTASNTGGATWTQRLGPIGSGITTSAGAGIWDVTFSCRTVSDIAVGGTLTTLTFSNAVVAKLAVIVGLRGVQEVLRGTSTSGTSTSGVPTVTTGGTAPVTGDIVIGTASFESSATPGSDTDTSNGSWSTAVTEITAGGGAANTNIAQTVQYKIVTGGGHQTYNPTGANDSIASVRAFIPEPEPTVTQAAYRFYADGTETGSTALAGQDTGYIADVSGGDVNLQVRVREQSTNATALDATDDWQLQWEKNASGTWANVRDAAVPAESYGSAFRDSQASIVNATTAFVGQSFLGDGGYLSQAGFYLSKANSPTGNLIAELRTHTGTFGSTGTSGTVLATSSSVDMTPLVAGSFAWFYFPFDGTYLMAGGTPYFVTVRAESGSVVDGTNTVLVGDDTAGAIHPGTFTNQIGPSSTVDLCFEIYSLPTTVAPYASANLTALVDSYPSANSSSTLGLQVGSVAVTACQSFLGDGGRLTQAGFYASSTGTSNGTVTAVLYAHTGTFGTGTPTGSPLATSTSVNTVTLGTLGWKYFTFDGTFTLTPGTAYCIGLTTTNTTFAACTLRTDSTTPTHAGSASRYSTSWIAIADDLIFEVYTAGNVPTTNRLTGGSGTFTAGKVSETGLVTDLGWSGNNYTVLLYSVTLKAADVADTDVIRFRVLRNGATTGLTYTATPTLTASMGVGGSYSKGSTPLTVTATITAAGVVERSSGATLAVTSTITAAGTLPVTGYTGTGTLPATATITSTGVVGTSRASTALAVTATITAAGVVARASGSTLAVTDSITAAGTMAATSSAALPVTATITAAGSVVSGSSGTAFPTTVTATITAAGVVARTTTAVPLTVTAATTAAGTIAATLGTTRPTTATITAAGLVGASTGATLPTTATITTAGVLNTANTAALAVTATITPSGAVTVVGGGGATFPVTATITAAGVVAKTGTATLPVTAAIAAAGVVARASTATRPVTATVTSAGILGYTRTATLTTTATITAAGVVARTSTATLATTATITAAGAVVVAGGNGATLAVAATVTAAGTVGRSTSVTPVAVTATITAAGTLTGRAAVATTATIVTAGRMDAATTAALTVTTTIVTVGRVAVTADTNPLTVTALITATGGVVTADDGTAVPHPHLTVYVATSTLTITHPDSSLQVAAPLGDLQVTHPDSDLTVALPVRELELTP